MNNQEKNTFFAWFDVDQNCMDDDSFFEIEMTRDEALSVSQQGDNSQNVRDLIKHSPKIKAQLEKISDQKLRGALWGYGAWGNDELESRTDNEERIVWIAGNNIKEENGF